MIVRLVLTNGLQIPFVLNSESASGQPLAPGVQLEAMFELYENSDGVAELHLYVDPYSRS